MVATAPVQLLVIVAMMAAQLWPGLRGLAGATAVTTAVIKPGWGQRNNMLCVSDWSTAGLGR